MKRTTHIITVGQSDQHAEAVNEASQALKEGKLVCFATETVYGVSALATCPQAVADLGALKERPQGPWSVHVGSPHDVQRYVNNVPEIARRLIRRTWPGPVTLLMQLDGTLADPQLQAVDGLYDLLTTDDVIGLRCPADAVTQKLLTAAGGPVIATSANLKAQPSPKSAADVIAALDGKVDVIVDSGPARYGKDSTIVLFDSDGWQCIRDGVVDREMLAELLAMTVAFVCTGNTCRSPMAEGLAKTLLAEKLGCLPDELLKHGYNLLSAGVFAGNGQPATQPAVQAAAALGANICSHRSKKLTPELINACDLVFCMTEFHLQDAKILAGSSDVEIRLLDECDDIPDPIGGGDVVYARTAEHLLQAIRKQIDNESL